MNHAWYIERVHYGFLCTSSVPLEKGLYIDIVIIFVSRPIDAGPGAKPISHRDASDELGMGLPWGVVI